MSLNVAIRKKVKNFRLEVDFESEGGCLGILGASGCGKSMTLQCIAGIMTPDEGHIELNGRVLFDSAGGINEKPQKRGVGYLFQNYALFPNMTVEQNIAAGLDRSRSVQQVERMIRMFRLQGLEKHRPFQLSGGQQQRVALARLLAYEPEVMLLDEPFSALDAYLKEELQLEFLSLLEQYAGDAVMVTHSRDEAYQLCDRVCLLDEGRIICRGRTGEIFRNPTVMKAARLTGCKNISAARALADGRVEALDWGLTLTVKAPLPEKLAYIGIRAHDFHAVRTEETENVFPCRVREISESPFEWSILLYTQKEEGPALWWKIGKHQLGEKLTVSLPEFLTVAPEDILLLEA